MKKILTLLAVLTLILTLSGCKDNNSSSKENNFDDQPQIQEEIKEDEKVETNEDSLVNPEFKAAMDSYELFFDEYIAFMEKYSEADDPSSMMLDYLSYLARFSETMDALSKIEEEDMNEAEAIYYLEVSTRIMEKISKVEF